MLMPFDNSYCIQIRPLICLIIHIQKEIREDKAITQVRNLSNLISFLRMVSIGDLSLLKVVVINVRINQLVWAILQSIQRQDRQFYSGC